MKKILVGLMVLVLGAGVVFATSTNTYTNALGQVVTVVVLNDGTRTTTITQPVTVAAASRTVINLPGMQVSASAATIDTTVFTPRDLGDFLLFTVSNTLYVATGVTTNDWTALN